VILNISVITTGRCSHFVPLWLTHDFTGNNIPGLEVDPEVKGHPNYGISVMMIFVLILC
jgi:hypothetical protein